MANLIKKNLTKEKAIEVELPDGTAGEIPIVDSAARQEIIKGYGNGDMITHRKARKKEIKQMRELKKSAVAFTRDKERREEAEHRRLTLEGGGFESKKSERKTKRAFRKQRRAAVKATKEKVRKSVSAFMSDKKRKKEKG